MLDFSGNLFLIDFGLAHRFLDSNGNHVSFKRVRRFKGTWYFCSKNTMQMVLQSRRDDVESMFYTLMYLIDVRMAWVPLQGGTKENVQKELRTNKDLMTDLQIIKQLPSCFRKLYWLVRYISYD